MTQDIIKAATHYKRWGRYATTRFIEKRGIPRGLLRLALQLEATK